MVLIFGCLDHGRMQAVDMAVLICWNLRHLLISNLELSNFCREYLTNFQTKYDMNRLTRFEKHYETEIIEMPVDFTHHIQSI